VGSLPLSPCICLPVCVPYGVCTVHAPLMGEIEGHEAHRASILWRKRGNHAGYRASWVGGGRYPPWYICPGTPGGHTTRWYITRYTTLGTPLDLPLLPQTQHRWPTCLEQALERAVT